MNPSPPFLGFVAAASDKSGELLREQVQLQKTGGFKPPHPEGSMVSEKQLRMGSIGKEVHAESGGEVGVQDLTGKINGVTINGINEAH